MAVVLNRSKLTQKQIEAAEPLVRAIEKYDRQIAAEKVCKNIMGEPFEKAKLRRDRIAKLETRKRSVMDDLEMILNARNAYDKKFGEAEEIITDLERIKEQWGF